MELTYNSLFQFSGIFTVKVFLTSVIFLSEAKLFEASQVKDSLLGKSVFEQFATSTASKIAQNDFLNHFIVEKK